MSNCTGYNFGSTLTLCGEGAIGGGNSADLGVNLSNGQTLNGSTTIVGWDGTELVIDMLAEGLSNGQFLRFDVNPFETCTIDSATLTLIPDGVDTNTGMALFELVIKDCDGGASLGTPTTTPTLVPYTNDSCGGIGPHTITEMIPFTLADGGCA